MKRSVLIIIMSFCFVLLGFYLIFVPKVQILDNNIEVNSSTINIKYRVFTLINDLTNKTSINNNIDTSRLGSNYVELEFKYMGFNIKKKIEVNIVDNNGPIISLNGSTEVNVCPNKEYIEEGFSVIDNYDSDLIDKVVVTNNKDAYIYEVEDSSNNKTKVIRKINYIDSENPVIALNGSNVVYLYAGNSYYEHGYTANDNCDGDITDKVVVTNNIDVYSLGTYNVTYTVTDSSNNSYSINREVKVIEKPTSYGNGIIYLTFDDGPSSTITPGILDILDSEGVKATFFIMNKADSLNYLIEREYNSGNTVALHTSTHSYSYIYSSSENYFNDLNTISDKVYNLIGVRSNIIRFPGGSSNTVSRNYSYGIMSYLVGAVTERGYHYFDWNVDSDDAGSASSSAEVYYNVVNNLSHSKTNVVLMHDFDNNYKTLYALRDIIQFGKQNGYTFSNITYDTPVVHHGVNN